MTNTITTNDPIIRIGDTGDKVRDLQQLLRNRILRFSNSLFDLAIDGIFGRQTEVAVKTVQFQFLLNQDGIATPQTWASLRADQPVGLPVLRLESRGQEVERAQRVLALPIIGSSDIPPYYTGAIDGIFGAQTQKAVKRFQQENRLVADGVIGSRTWKALSDYATAFQNE